MKTVVIVDDEKDIVTILSELLETIDAKILGVSDNGKDAVDLIIQREPDFVFLDLMLPTKDGFYTIEQVTKSNKKIRIIVITGDVRKDTQDKLKSFGITDILHKPLDFDYILNMVRDS